MSIILAFVGITLTFAGLFFGRQINETAVWLLGYFRRNPFAGIYSTVWQYVEEGSDTETFASDFLEIKQRGRSVKGSVFYSTNANKYYRIEGRVEHNAISGQWINESKGYKGFFLWANTSYNEIDGAWIGPDRHGRMLEGSWHLRRMVVVVPTGEYFFNKRLHKMALLDLVATLKAKPHDRILVDSLKLVLTEGVFDPTNGNVSLELLDLLRGEGIGTALDLGTGCGLYALFLAKKGFNTSGTDVSIAAINCAQANANLNGIKGVKFLRGDLFEAVGQQKFDLICANLPFTRKELCRPIRKSKYFTSFACNGDLLKRFIFEVPEHLTNRGSVLFAFGSSGDLRLLYLCCTLAGLEIQAEKVLERKDLGETFLVFRGRKGQRLGP